MSHIIDRRLNPKDKNLGNRQRLLRRSKDVIKKAIKNSVLNKNIKDIGKDEPINIPIKDISEPQFRHSNNGDKDFVLPGNEEFVEGDQIKKPSGGGGGQGNEGSPDGDGEDEFQFTLTREEFLEFFFEDLELPDLVKQKLSDTTKMKSKFSGFSKSGSTSNLDVKRSFKASLSRRLAVRRPTDKEIAELEEKLLNCEDEDEKAKLQVELDKLLNQRKRIPFFDDLDMRYRLYLPNPSPASKAAMFCIMDVSASMGEREKDISKRFFMLLHLFLERKYEKVDLIFVRHHSVAEEVDEHTFFYDRATGGTVVSTALEKTIEIIKERYPLADWNIYVSQSSDGDNYNQDNKRCAELLDELLPMVQYYAYIEIPYISSYGYHASYLTDLWKTFQQSSQQHKNLQCRSVEDVSQIFPVFRELFAKERTTS